MTRQANSTNRPRRRTAILNALPWAVAILFVTGPCYGAEEIGTVATIVRHVYGDNLNLQLEEGAPLIAN